MRVLVIGAGVIGAVHAARLSYAGHDVSLLARGERRAAFEAEGVVLHSSGRTIACHPRIVGPDDAPSLFDLTLVAVRTTQLGAILDLLQSAIASTGMHTAMEPDMPGWLATHEVFMACLGAGILCRGGEASALADDPVRLRAVVRAIREGFTSLSSSGVTITPRALRALFTRMPQWFAAAYWRRALRGPVGTVAIAPHVRASRDDEFAALCRDVLDGVARPDLTPTLTSLLEPWAGDSP